MKIFVTLFSAIIFLGACNSTKKSKTATTNNYQDKIELKDYVDSVSYAIGLLYGEGLKKQGFDDLNNELLLEVLSQSLSNKLSGDSGLIKQQDANPIVNNYFIKKKEVMAAKNQAEGAAFLEANKTKKGIITTASGLQYKVLKEGSGKSPNSSSQVTVHYKGTLLDGRVFDQTKDNPASFGVSGLIRGWKEGLLLMKEGAKFQFFVPGNLAYGPNGFQGSIIGPNAALIFEVELVKVN